MTMSLSGDTLIEVDARRMKANAEAAHGLCEAERVWVDVCVAGDVVPRLTPTMILTSGAPMPWDGYTSGQRRALLAGARYEGLASDRDEAGRKLDAGEIQASTTHEPGCIGSVAGIYTASSRSSLSRTNEKVTSVFITLYEGGKAQRRLSSMSLVLPFQVGAV